MGAVSTLSPQRGPIGGGASTTLAPGEGQVRYLAWKGNTEIVAEDATPKGRWWRYRIGEVDRAPLWDPAGAAELRQLTFRPDGTLAAALAFTPAGPDLVRLDGAGTVIDRSRVKGRPSWPSATAQRFTDNPRHRRNLRIPSSA